MSNYTCLYEPSDDFSQWTDARLLQTIVDARNELSRIRAAHYPNPVDSWEQTDLILALFAERDRRGLP